MRKLHLNNDSEARGSEKPIWNQYLAPKFWPTWIGFGFFYLLTRLPRPVVMKCGRGIGMLLPRLIRNRGRITAINLRLAFPEKTESERETLAKRAFSHLGMAITETAWLWSRDKSELGPVDIIGEEHVKEALATGKGIILLQAHFTMLETCAAFIGPRYPAVSAVYDPPKNPLFRDYLHKQRSRHLTSLIDNRNIREMIRRLRRGEIVWFSPDQSVAASHGGIIADFFNQPALTSSGTARILKMTGAILIPFIPTRMAKGDGYTIKFGSPIEIDTKDVMAATQRVNDTLEEHVRSQPEQYLWAHKRFKAPSRRYDNPYA